VVVLPVSPGALRRTVTSGDVIKTPLNLSGSGMVGYFAAGVGLRNAAGTAQKVMRTGVPARFALPEVVQRTPLVTGPSASGRQLLAQNYGVSAVVDFGADDDYLVDRWQSDVLGQRLPTLLNPVLIMHEINRVSHSVDASRLNFSLSGIEARVLGLRSGESNRLVGFLLHGLDPHDVYDNISRHCRIATGRAR
jgi:hypothetical protein